MFESESLYCQTNFKTASREWFFTAREGIVGPFPSRESAASALLEFMKSNDENAHYHARDSGHYFDLKLLPGHSSLIETKQNHLFCKALTLM